MERFHPRIALRWLLGRVFILYFLNLATLMYALFERIGDEDESSGESQVLTDPCDVEKTTVIMVKLAQRSRSYFLKDNQTQHTIKRREAFNVTETFNQTKVQDECWETGFCGYATGYPSKLVSMKTN